MASKGSARAEAARAISSALVRHRLANIQAPLVLAVSGGQDSLALLVAAASLPRRRRLALVVAHFSHGLRPSADPKTAALVKRVALSLGIAVLHGHGEAGPSEAAARYARYTFLAEASRSVGASAVLTAHTEDDQAETVLLRLARGTGTRGAGAIRELSTRNVGGHELVLLRPLLTVSRGDTAEVCAEAGVKPMVDGSNRSLRFARNRVRSRVLPELERLNPKVKAALAEFAGSMQSDDELLVYLAAQSIEGIERRTGEVVAWPRQALAALEVPLLVRVLQSAWEYLAGDGAMLSARRIQAVRRLAAGPGGQLDLGHGLCFCVEQNSAQLGRSGVPFLTLT
jgi:tRNA(Ile)-lysidine synthase